MKFKIGQIVEHALSKDWLLVLKCEEIQNEQTQYECRTKGLETKWFYEYELKEK